MSHSTSGRYERTSNGDVVGSPSVATRGPRPALLLRLSGTDVTVTTPSALAAWSPREPGGVGLAALLGATLAAIIAEERDAAAGGERETIRVWRDRDGVDGRVRVQILGAEPDATVVVVLTDVTQPAVSDPERLRVLLESMPESIYFKDVDSRFVVANRALAHALGQRDPEDLVGLTDADFYPAADAARYRADEVEVIASGRSMVGKIEPCVVRGEQRWFATTKAPIRDDAGNVVGLVGISRDVTDRRLLAGRMAAEAEVLKRLSSGQPLDEVLTALIGMIEDQCPGMLGSVLRLDPTGRRLERGVGPSLPPGYMAAINGVEIGAEVGSCGTAAHGNTRVITEDIETDPKWAPYRSVAAAAGLRACWSQPIHDSEGRVRGTFAMYYRTPRRPNEDEQQLIDFAATLAGIAIEREASETALWHEQRMLQILMDRIPDAIYFKDADQRFLRVNRAQARYLGLENPEVAVGRHDVEFFSAEAAAGYAADDRRVIETGVPIIGKVEHNGASGEERRWFSTTKTPFRDERGEIVGLVGISRDITERIRYEHALRDAHREIEARVEDRTKALSEANTSLFREMSDRQRAVEALRHSEVRYRAVVENAPDVIVCLGPDFRVSEWNQAAETVLGRTRDEVIGTDFRDLCPADERRTLAVTLAAVLAGSNVRDLELPGLTRDGVERRLCWNLTPLSTGDAATGVIALGQDITERRRLEAARRESESRFRQLAEHIREVFWLTEWETGRVIYVSPAYESVFGRPAEAIYRNSQDWIDAIHPEDRERVKASFFGSAERGGYDEEYRIIRPNGSQRWIRDRGFLIRNELGRVYRIAGIAADVTARREAEEAARQHQAKLAHVSRLSTMGEMTAGLAHELNQPLAAIVNFAEACLREIRSGRFDRDVASEDLEQVIQQAVRAGAIIRRLRSFVRKEAPSRSEADVSELVREIMPMLDPLARRGGITIRTDLGDALPPVRLDPIQIQQVIFNVTRNGIEAMIDAAEGKRQITVATRAVAGDRVEIAISNAGPPLEPGMATRIFEPFYTTKGGGMGLGLAIASGIVEAHGGRIWVDETFAPGVMFRIEIPFRGEPHES
ncbi:MAG: PAS domain-containing protein [Phycisphaerae bacterium]|nr:PAS domain-containing protein [Phycisphaerae bacterium]NNF44011.1 PAS domain-containing protein [Phycisphaerales bacterium]